MINSIINGTKIYNEKNTMFSKDIFGNNLDEVHIFDEKIEKYIPDLLESLNIWKKTSIDKRLDSIRSIKSILEKNLLVLLLHLFQSLPHIKVFLFHCIYFQLVCLQNSYLLKLI